jgi:hypothetical protein
MFKVIRNGKNHLDVSSPSERKRWIAELILPVNMATQIFDRKRIYCDKQKGISLYRKAQ